MEELVASQPVAAALFRQDQEPSHAAQGLRLDVQQNKKGLAEARDQEARRYVAAEIATLLGQAG